MDKKQITPTIQSQLWIGNHTALIKEVKQWLLKELCPNNGCSVCVLCRRVHDYQHHTVQWLSPENRYSIDQFDPIKHALSFALDEDEKQFFIIQKADFLTPTCANSLLKCLEEPPPGFYFLLTAERLHAILPTIISRCAVKQFHEQIPIQHPIVTYFTTQIHCNSFEFISELEAAALTEHDSVELLDDIFAYWLAQFKKNPLDKSTFQIIAFLKKQMEIPPMPGSSKIFWKNMYLGFISLTTPLQEKVPS